MANTNTTNVSLAKPIKEGHLMDDFNNLYGAFINNMDRIEKNTADIAVIATNATVVNTAGAKIVMLYNCSACSITSITGMVKYVPFIMIAGANGSYNLGDAGNFVLSAAWNPQANDNITLVWNGTNYIEVSRVNN